MAESASLGNAYVTIIPSMRGFEREMNKGLSGIDLTRTGKRLGASLGGSMATAVSDRLVHVGDGLVSAGSKLADVGGKLTAGITVPLVGATAAAGTFALRTASAAETTEISFTTMLGSEEAALSMMEELADFAAHTPFELSGLQTATRQLLAYGFTAEDVVPMLTAVGDATAALGTGQAGIESVTRALGQMQTRGKVSAEEMLQLTEAGIPAWEYLAEAIGTDTAGAMDAVSKGAVSASEGIDAIVSGMENDFGGMMEEQSKTVEGLFSNLSDAIEQPLMKLRDSEAYERFAESLADVVDAAGPFVESLLPHMERGLDAVSGVLDAATDAMEGFASMSEEEQGQLIDMAVAAAAAGPALTVAGKGMELLGTVTKGAGKAIEVGQKAVGTLGDKILDFATAPETAGTVLGKFAGVLTKIPTPAALAGVAIGGVLVSGVVDYYNWATKADREAEVQAEALRVLADASSVAGESMEEASEAPRMLGTEIYNLGEEIQENWQSIADLGSAFNEIDAKASAQVTQLSSARGAIADYNGQADLSAQQLGSFRAAIETVNDQCGTNYEVVKDAGGAYHVMRDGAKVAADELYKLIDAQIAQVQVSAQMDKLESLYSEQAEQATEYAEAVRQVADAQEAYNKKYQELMDQYGDEKIAETGSSYLLDGLNEAKANLAEVEEQMGATADATEAVEESIGNLTAVVSGAVEGFDALVQGSGSLNTFFAETGGSMDEFADDLEASGVSLETFASMGQDELMRLAASWDGTEASVTTALSEMGYAVEGYNAIDLSDKDATATVNDMGLRDAQGNVYTWNGSELVDQNGVAAVEDSSLIDAQGNVWVWNGSQLVPLSTTAQVTGNVPSGQAKRSIDDTNASARAMTSRTVTDTVRGSALTAAGKIWDTVDAIGSLSSKDVYVNTHYTTYEKVIKTVQSAWAGDWGTGNAAGGIRLDAAGGILPRYHAAGAIATRAVPLDIVGEDGAEAIVPLTNRRYSQPFADVIAEGVSRRITAGTTNLYIDGSLVAVDSRIAQALSALLGAVGRRYDMGGVRA